MCVWMCVCTQVTFTDGATGETVRAFTIKGDPQELHVAVRRDDGTRNPVSHTHTHTHTQLACTTYYRQVC